VIDRERYKEWSANWRHGLCACFPNGPARSFQKRRLHLRRNCLCRGIHDLLISVILPRRRIQDSGSCVTRRSSTYCAIPTDDRRDPHSMVESLMSGVRDAADYCIFLHASRCWPTKRGSSCITSCTSSCCLLRAAFATELSIGASNWLARTPDRFLESFSARVPLL